MGLGLSIVCLSPAAAASAKGGSGLSLTVAARVCPTYEDISANLARNNIMESLRDLGPDTPYRPGEPVNPVVEERSQPECRALPGWRFTLGDSYITRAVSGPWGSLSIVRNPLPRSIIAQQKVPLLDAQGLPTGRSIEGATTFELNSQEAALATRSQSLWIQGGTPTDPILNQEFPGPEYGFGALRCAIDNVNGDNVEYIAYPAGVTHVFCFAYYVEPPPTSGTIVVRKQVEAAPGVNESFNFDGNVSYNPGGRFSLAVKNGAPASETFYRAATGPGNGPWTVRELATPNWRLAGLTCSSEDHSSKIETSAATGVASIELGPGDLVTCTYTDRFEPPPHGLSIRKVTEGGFGQFGYAVTPEGGGSAVKAVATTTEEGVAVDANPSPLELSAGRYDIRESSPSTSRGHWELREVQCGGHQQPTREPIEVELSAGGLLSCTFQNTFVPSGSITISKITKGAVGTSGFTVSQLDHPATQYRQRATTTRVGVPVIAHGDSTDSLELGRYSILDQPPEPHEGSWQLAEAACNGEVVPTEQGEIEAALTQADRHLHCVFTNVFSSSPPPKPPGPQPPSAKADLLVTKRATTDRARVGELLHYRITVTNRGPDPAAEVTLIDQPKSPADLVSAGTSHGSCTKQLPMPCNLGAMAPGEKVSIGVALRVRGPGLFINRAVAETTTEDPDLRSAEAESRVRILTPRPVPPVVGLG